MRIERELMRGAGPVAVLKLLERGEMYGYQLVEALDQRTSGVLGMGQSTLYPLLYNLEAKGLIAARWDTSDGGRDRKYYSLTDAGRKRLKEDAKQWESVMQAMAAIGVVSARALAGATTAVPAPASGGGGSGGGGRGGRA